MTEKPSRNEEEYFARRDAELLRQQRTSLRLKALESERHSHYMKCPSCGYDLIRGEWHGVQVDQCTHCHGIWFEAAEARGVLEHAEPNIITRVFHAVMRGISTTRVGGR